VSLPSAEAFCGFAADRRRAASRRRPGVETGPARSRLLKTPERKSTVLVRPEDAGDLGDETAVGSCIGKKLAAGWSARREAKKDCSSRTRSCCRTQGQLLTQPLDYR